MFPMWVPNQRNEDICLKYNNFIISFSELFCVFPCQAVSSISLQLTQLDLKRSSHPLSDDRADCKHKNQSCLFPIGCQLLEHLLQIAARAGQT